MTKKLASYLETNVELKDCIFDYIKLVVHHKPENIYDFTVNYFTK
jgi:hypothetical protein